MRTGVLNVHDGKIVGLNPNLVTRNSNNGNTVYGPALAVSKHVTDAALEINIYGGEFDGLYAIYESNHMAGNPQPEVTNTSINIQDGVFKTRNGGTEAVYSQNITGFISGGIFSTEISQEYCAQGYAPVMNDNGEYVVEELNAVLTDAGADAITAGDGTGTLRFITKAESLSGAPTSYGTYMVPVSIFDKTGLDDCVTVTYTQSIEEGDTYAADLTNIPAEYLGTKIFARSFIFLPGIDNPVTVELNPESVNSAMSK